MMLPLLVVLAAGTAVPPPTTELDTPRFKILHTERATAAAKLLAEEIEVRRDEIRDVLGRDWEGTTEVRLGWGRAEYEALAPFGTTPPSWAAALAWPEENVMLLEAQSLTKGDGQETLRHELIHIALGRLGHNWPRWFQEGLAQHLTGERRFSVEHYTTLARAVSADRVFKLDDLANGFPEKPADVEIAYSESAAFILFLTERHPREAFGQLVDGVGRGETFEIAFAKAFHTSLNLEERTFREELPGRYPFWPIVTTGTSLWVFASLLVVVGYVRRRRAVLLKRAEQEAEEAAEDAAARILAAEQERALAEGMPQPPVDPPTYLH
jgi:hypothetical protein